MVTARTVMWYSLVLMGFLVSLVVPTGAIFGFSFGVFMAALAKESIGYRGLMLFYALFIPADTINIYFVTDTISKSAQPFLTTLGNNLIFKNPDDAVEYFNAANSPLLYVGFMVLYLSFVYVQPMCWFYGCRKVIKKVKIRERIGIIKNN